jgi:putative peptidoglycan lipid II flippase
VLLFFATPVTEVVFHWGKYTWADVLMTSATLRWMVPFMLAAATINLLKKVYFALEDRNTLLVIGAVGVVLTGGLGMVLVPDHGVPGLAAALSASTVIQGVAYIVVLHRRLKKNLGLAELMQPMTKMLLATVPVAAFLWVAQGWASWEDKTQELNNVVVLAGSLVGAGVLYVGAAWALGLKELSRMMAKLRR